MATTRPGSAIEPSSGALPEAPRLVQNRFVIPVATIESEFAQAGFKVVDHLDFIPYYAMWRVYVLRKV